MRRTDLTSTLKIRYFGFLRPVPDDEVFATSLTLIRHLKIDVYVKRQTASEVFDFTTLL